MRNGKRIHKITIKRETDDSPDTSYLGEYSNRPTSEFSIDREHSVDCASQTYNHVSSEGSRLLDNANDYLQDAESETDGQMAHETGCSHRFSDNAECICLVSAIHEGYDAAHEILESLRDNDCTCGQHGDRLSREFQYFNPCHENYAGIERSEVIKYCLQDYARMEDYNNQGWCYLLIGADAEIVIDGHVQHITSGWVGGIESDMDESELQVTEQDQLAELKDQLHAIGFSRRAISAAFRGVSNA